MTIPERFKRNVVGVGEAMVEFAPVGDGLYRRGFAGDTLNSCWHMAELLGETSRVSFLTRVGDDPYSSQFLAFLQSNGLDASKIRRDPRRSIGLYVISLAGAERSFTYWRETSAARKLADDRDALDEALRDADLIHTSGITLAVIGDQGRRNLLSALDRARSNGSVVSFDPNARLQLWSDTDAFRQAARDMFEVTDIALPSFDDEAQVWGDSDPQATTARMGALGVSEIVVKNGAGVVTVSIDGEVLSVPTPAAQEVRDTTGAGDSFNAGYLAGRLAGMTALKACELGQQIARTAIAHYGALAPKDSLQALRETVRQAMANGEAVGSDGPRRQNCRGFRAPM